MNKDTRLGDSMPNRRNVKWGDMTASTPHMSDEWNRMEPSSGHMSEKWVDQTPSSPRMSEKWVDMEASDSSFSNKFHSMTQEGRMDPYRMAPSEGDRESKFKSMPKERADGGRVSRSTQHTEFGSTREL